MPTPYVLHRTVSHTSRALEFFTPKELAMQLGFERSAWPIALTKELIDNALDACETTGQLPVIGVTLTEDTLTVEDNGPGVPVAVLERSLNYLERVSDKMYYLSPTRGQLGNALKCVWAAPFVVDGSHGRVDIRTGGTCYRLDVTLDRLAQVPKLRLNTTPALNEDGFVKSGTSVTMHWPGIASVLHGAQERVFYNERHQLTMTELLQRYALFNPHARFFLADRDGLTDFPGTMSTFRKWCPTDPTSPHWYTPECFQKLLTAYVVEDRRQGIRRSVRAVVAEFAGLAGTAAQREVATAAGLARATLEDLVEGETLRLAPIAQLLKAMQARSRPLAPRALGVLGADSVTHILTERFHIARESVEYRKREGMAGTLPYVLEVACGWKSADTDATLHKLLGYNFTPALGTPFQQLGNVLDEARVDHYDPVAVVVHLVCPRLETLDRGKTAVALPSEIAVELAKAVQGVCKPWTKLKQHADRANRVRERAMDDALKARRQHAYDLKTAAWEVMEEAYRQASDNGSLPANARQIFYAARPLILALTSLPLRSVYFTQRLLPDFVEAFPALTAAWDVVFDARGHFQEPHTTRQLGLGTLEVRQYLHQWRSGPPPATSLGWTFSHAIDTVGPASRYQFALFIEKEGFTELFARAQLAARYDLAIMSTKGQTVTAVRQLTEALTHAGVTVLVLHDFDKSGLEIWSTFYTDTRRYRYATRPKVIDLGLRLPDVEALGLPSEPVQYSSGVDPRENLRRCGASEAECDFLVQHRRVTASAGQHAVAWEGARVELNAMPSRQLLTWLEAKLVAAGVAKVVPDDATLAAAYRSQCQIATMQHAVDAAVAALPAPETIPVPAGLATRLRETLTGTALQWEDALWGVVLRQQPHLN